MKGPHRLGMAEAEWTCQNCFYVNLTEWSKCIACDWIRIQFGDESTLKEDEVGISRATFLLRPKMGGGGRGDTSVGNFHKDCPLKIDIEYSNHDNNKTGAIHAS